MDPRPYQWSLDNPSGYSNSMGRYKTEVEWAFLTKHIPPPPLSILDIGGGSGRFALPLARMGHRVTVVDPARDALQELERQQANISVIRGDFLSTPLDKGSFDIAVAVESLQYLVGGDFATIFERVRAVLRPQGIFLFTELNSRSWRYVFHRLRRHRMVYKVAGTGDYRSALQAAGFAIREVSGFVWMPFGATSNSRLVPAFAWLERALGLRQWPAQSPWLLFAVQAPP